MTVPRKVRAVGEESIADNETPDQPQCLVIPDALLPERPARDSSAGLTVNGLTPQLCVHCVLCVKDHADLAEQPRLVEGD